MSGQSNHLDADKAQAKTWENLSYNDDSSSDSSSKSVKCCSVRGWLTFLRRNILLILLLVALGAGIGMGAGLSTLEPPFSKRDLMYFRFPGDLLMRMLKALIIPLVVSSLVSGLGGLDPKSSGKMGLYAILYYFSTTFIAVLLGILLVCTIQPGVNSNVGEAAEEGTAEPANIADSFLDLVRNMFPDNLVEACFRQTKTDQVPIYGYVNKTSEMNVTNSVLCDNDSSIITLPDSPYVMCNITQNVSTIIYYDFQVIKADGMNVLGLVVFSLALGIVVSGMGERGKPIYYFCFALAEATMKLVVAVIWYSPIGIMFLIAAEIIDMEDPLQELQALGLYMATVLAGLGIHGVIILPALYLIFVRKNPYKYLYGLIHALLTAFGTASSSATLPVTYRCLEINNNIDSRVTRFLLPVGATINMDGTALYEAVAAIFIAQTNGIELNAAEIVAVSITATLASIGAASVPQAGLVTMVIVLSAIGLPAEEVSKIIAVDWLLDRFRTAVNVEGDAFGAGIVHHLCRKELAHDLDAPVENHDIENLQYHNKESFLQAESDSSGIEATINNHSNSLSRRSESHSSRKSISPSYASYEDDSNHISPL